MTIQNKLSSIVKNQFPDFFAEDGENFLAFIKAYYEYLEQEGKLNYVIQNLDDYLSIDTTTEEYLEYFRKELLPSVPTNVLANKKLLAKHIKMFNSSRGTYASYKFLFRILYNEDVELNFPADYILKVSDSQYKMDRYLVTSYDKNTYRFIGKTIKGVNSKAEALVENVVRRVIRGRDLLQILLSNIKGTFQHLEPVMLLDESSSHTPIVEAGIKTITIESPGGGYVPGDIVDIISEEVGQYGKAVIVATVDLNGSLVYTVVDGGSGYAASTNAGGRTQITFSGGDGSSPGSFAIRSDDLGDLFAITLNTNYMNANNIFGELAPVIDGIRMSTFANTPISCPNYGFPEAGEVVTSGVNFHDHANAVIRIANTATIPLSASLFGSTTGANAFVLEIVNPSAGNTWLRVDAYKNFDPAEDVKIGANSGPVVGTVTSFQGNTVGYHVLEVGNNAGTTISENDEVVGITTGAFGVVKKVLSIVPNGYNGTKSLVTVQVTSNNTANTSDQFDTGPMMYFLQNEGIRKVGGVTPIGNAASTTSNAIVENMYTSLSDSFLFTTSTLGTIERISLPIGGSGYTVAPTITVNNPDISALGIGEYYITLQSNNANWGTGNVAITKLDTNDRIVQSNTGASGDVKGSLGSSILNVTNYANGMYEMVARVWQPIGQRSPGMTQFANNQHVDLLFFNTSYVFGDVDDRTPSDYGSAKIVRLDDNGILGQNANIRATVGANGTISAIKPYDSGFSYKQNEVVTIADSGRVQATGARGVLTLSGVANSEGYYTSTRSHISSKQGILQDSRYYQEYSYEIISKIPINIYRDVAQNLVHGAGQIMFGRFRTQSNSAVNVSANTNNSKITKISGSVSVANNSYDLLGTGTNFTTSIANNGVIFIEVSPKAYYKLPINIVSNNTFANTKVSWSNASIAAANVYYNSGSI